MHPDFHLELGETFNLPQCGWIEKLINTWSFLFTSVSDLSKNTYQYHVHFRNESVLFNRGYTCTL